jgi:hypothetical protein
MSNAGNTEWIYASANLMVAQLLILIFRTRELCTTDEINQGKVSGRVPFGFGTLSLWLRPECHETRNCLRQPRAMTP